MISFFRSFFQSKVGLFITMAFVALIAVAFASADVTGSGSFGGISDTAVADIGGEEIGTGQFLQTANIAYDQVREENPGIDMASFVDQGGLQTVLSQMIDAYAMQEFGRKNGMIVSKRLVDSEIAGIGGFRGANGQFDEQIFRQALQQQGLTEARLRSDLQRGLMADQILTPVSYGVRLPNSLVAPYASIILEGREGEIALVPSTEFFPKDKPGDKAIAEYFKANSAKYRKAETRVLRYATFTTESLESKVVVTDAQIAELFEDRRAEFAASETRSLSQLIVPTQAAAQKLADAVKGGATLESVAATAGLSANTVDTISKKEFSSASSKAVADAAFSADQGAVANVARSGLGWHVIKVRTVARVAAKTLADVRPQLETELRQIGVREAIAELTENIEDRFADGATLPEVAEAQGLKVVTSPALAANGTAPANPAFKPEGVYPLILQLAFAMEEDASPQLIEVAPGQVYAFFDVAKITPSAPPPLATIRAQVEQDYMFAQGAKGAKKLADKLAKSAKSIDDVTAGMKAANIRAPNVERIGTTRQQMTQNGQRVPPPVALMFSMAEGTTKVLEAPADRGYFIVHLRKINRGDASTIPGLIAQTAQELSGVAGDEYRKQFLAAIAKEVKIERNENAIKVVADQMAGRNRDN